MDGNELAWCAGLYEGEGNIHLSTQWALMVSVVNVDKDLLEPFTMFGGEVKPRTKPTNPSHKQSYSWRIGGNNQIKSFIDAILPHIRSARKRSLLELASEFITFDRAQKETPTYLRDHTRYDTYYQRFKELH